MKYRQESLTKIYREANNTIENDDREKFFKLYKKYCEEFNEAINKEDFIDPGFLIQNSLYNPGACHITSKIIDRLIYRDKEPPLLDLDKLTPDNSFLPNIPPLHENKTNSPLFLRKRNSSSSLMFNLDI